MGKAVVEFIDIPQGKIAPQVCAQAQRFFQQRQRVLIAVADERQARALDSFMWTWDRLAFVPHHCDDGSDAGAAAPVLITAGEENRNGAGVLIVATECTMEFMSTFNHVVDFVPKLDEQFTAAARQRYKGWLEAGYAPEYIKQQ